MPDWSHPCTEGLTDDSKIEDAVSETPMASSVAGGDLELGVPDMRHQQPSNSIGKRKEATSVNQQVCAMCSHISQRFQLVIFAKCLRSHVRRADIDMEHVQTVYRGSPQITRF